MKWKAFIIPLSLFLVQAYIANGQFTPSEIAQREEMEEFLLTAEIIGHKKIGEGVTNPTRLFLKKGDVERSGVWKNPSGMQQGFLEGWQYEIAAYRLDKLLGLNMIPPTVERKFEGKGGSLQLWVEHQYSLLEIMEKNIPFPKGGPEADNVEKRKYLARAFDSLIGNEDRTQQNTFYTKDWRMLLIDHSRAFRSAEKFTKQLLYGRDPSAGRPMPFRRLPRKFVEKIKGLTFESVKNAVGPYLNDKEINAILIRKELVLKEIDEMIKESGEDKVLY